MKAKKIVSLLLAVITIFSVLQLTAFAIPTSNKISNMMKTAESCLGDTRNDYYGFPQKWCAHWVGWCAYKAGLANSRTQYADVSQMINLFIDQKGMYISSYFMHNVKWKERLSEVGVNVNKAKKIDLSFMPRRGDFILFQRGEGSEKGYNHKGDDEWFSHVGLVRSVTKLSGNMVRISTVEGNCDNKVAFREHTMDLTTGELGTLTEEDTFHYVIGFGRFN